MPKVGPCKTFFVDFVYGPWEMGIFGLIRNYFKSFELSPIFHSHGSMIYYNNQQQTNKASHVQNLLTACCDIGQSLPDLADVHRQIHFSSAVTQLPKKHVEIRKKGQTSRSQGMLWTWTSPMVVVDLPSPNGVGVIPATTTYFPSWRRFWLF